MAILLNTLLVALVLLMLPCGWRVWRGPTSGDRLLAIDLITTLLAGVMVTLGLQNGQGLYLDVALALGALSFIGTIGVARFIAEKQVF
ncbi:MAG: monovalent cation/H+ antiporter complex subunit F [Chloroflexota bacterium]